MHKILIIGFMAAVWAVAVHAEETSYPPMEPFAPFAGKTWLGEGTDEEGNDITDVSRWEFILGGRAVQATHRVQGSDYGGRTIIFYDEGAEEYIFHYFTTGGFHTQGTVEIGEGGAIQTFETVRGHPEITQVRSTIHLEEGLMRSDSDYLTADGWIPGHSFLYRPTETETVNFD